MRQGVTVKACYNVMTAADLRLYNSENVLIANSTASSKSHANGKIRNRSFRILRIGSDVFFDADSESPHMT